MKIVKTFLAAVAFFAMAFSIQAAPVYGGAITGPNVEKSNTSDGYGAWLQLRVKGIDNVGNTANGMTVNCPSCPGAATGATSQVSVTAIIGTAATSYYDKLTQSTAALVTAIGSYPALIFGSITTSAAAMATAANQALSFGSLTTTAAALIYTAPNSISFGARTVGWISLSQTAYTGLSPNATATFNVTTVAGSSAYSAYMVKLGVESGVTSMRAVFVHSATAPATFAATAGNQFFPSDNSKNIGTALAKDNPLTGVVPHFHLRPSALSGATSGTVWFELFGQP